MSLVSVGPEEQGGRMSAGVLVGIPGNGPPAPATRQELVKFRFLLFPMG